jgi:hypothetical protein
MFHDDAGISACILEADREDVKWRRRTLFAAGCFIGALLLMAWRLGEYQAYLEAAARV